MSSTVSALLILLVMVAAYIAAQLFKLSTELSIFVAALAGALAGGEWLPVRHLAEGAITYLDICLIFLTATLFMNLVREAGGVAFAVRSILRRFHRQKVVLFLLLVILLLIPGALTGAGSVTVLITGSLVAIVLKYMGLPETKVAAIIFLIAGLSAAAPPVSLWAMMTAAGINMPYVGFFLPLLIPCLLGAIAVIFILGWKAKPVDLEKALEEIPRPPEKMNWWRIGLPFLVFLLLVLAGRIFPFSFPVLGLPLIFALTALTAALLSPVKLNIWKISLETTRQLLPLIGTLTCVGILVQIMTLTGVRGLIAVSVVTLPVALVIASLFITLPISEAVLMWGAAPVLGVPLVLFFNTRGLNPVVALAAMSIIWPLGDALPPTAIIGRLTMNVVGVKEPYSKFLKQCLIPGIIITVLGMLMVIFSKHLGFLAVF
ncbi:MAG TPA: C4-dicarboxylate ABC transporter [Candidatus Saccharicenans sp.]|jgi:CitMHS family citrate-Mg2+:H+ or citrate-Ca2+:H+ symporter|nr:C4-dicarboxylate ABC transporter [Candidatus Saccharicenans sp.]HOL45738.1 C4-dicarboxylate ABC transporter [Candidatus Saccharicenans sp.]HOM93544.1 C4-dicarboxylate ABC transporter [Candidatus Saccharicenans sp.]HOT68872.1 C4-dicarboxylate ABC transporter [Candidatus Saccharicenans sp.]HPC87548.1 C4-dicarboxylate ABC transporter [Candidatus Saccharicenans sp.]